MTIHCFGLDLILCSSPIRCIIIISLMLEDSYPARRAYLLRTIIGSALYYIYHMIYKPVYRKKIVCNCGSYRQLYFSLLRQLNHRWRLGGDRRLWVYISWCQWF
ncbi:hypothetical protein BDV40DRAFT_283607, partial [Aspergillus tamarii]